MNWSGSDRQFHEHPELSSQEEQTAARIAELWQSAGAEVHRGIGGHGVVGIIKNGPGPTVMLRTDLDALPVVENTGLVYASNVKVKNNDGTTTGVMHACGHDIHMTNLTAVAQYMASHRLEWSGTIMLIGQPAEERGEGRTAHARRWPVHQIPQARHGVSAACGCHA